MKKVILLHSYHCDKVSPSDKKVFCKISGLGVIFIGMGLLVTAIIIANREETISLAESVKACKILNFGGLI